MNTPLTSAYNLQARKELTRLRLEMHRQQLRYHAQPLRSPLEHLGAFTGQGKRTHRSVSKGPLLLVSTALLAIFGKRLGKLGSLARLGLTIYPLIKVGEQLRR